MKVVVEVEEELEKLPQHSLQINYPYYPYELIQFVHNLDDQSTYSTKVFNLGSIT